jgi:hypothetical protein
MYIRLHAYRLELLASLRHLSVTRITCYVCSSSGFAAPEWYLICCRSGFSQPCMTETAGRVTPLHMLV